MKWLLEFRSHQKRRKKQGLLWVDSRKFRESRWINRNRVTNDQRTMMVKAPKEMPNRGESSDGVFLFHEEGTPVWPQEYYYFDFKAISCGKHPVAIPWFLFRKRKIPSFDSSWFVISYGAFAIVHWSLVTLLWLIHDDSRNLRELTRRRLWKKNHQLYECLHSSCGQLKLPKI